MFLFNFTNLSEEFPMGLLDQLAKGVTDKLSGEGGQNPIMDAALNLINNPQTGGLTGLVQTFKDKGLGDAVASWISTGENQQISAEQIQKVLGNQKIQQIAGKLGISTDELSGKLATMLPEVVDKLTPGGKLPEGGLLNQALDMLKGKMQS
jgi:uncharacterized protein YidB (DUF937 family)